MCTVFRLIVLVSFASVFKKSQAKENYRRLLRDPVALSSLKLNLQCITVNYCPKIWHSEESGSMFGFFVLLGFFYLYFLCVLCFTCMLRFWGKQNQPPQNSFWQDRTSLITKTKYTHLFKVVTGSPTTLPEYQQVVQAAPRRYIPWLHKLSSHKTTGFYFAPSDGAQEAKTGLSPKWHSPWYHRLRSN